MVTVRALRSISFQLRRASSVGRMAQKQPQGDVRDTYPVLVCLGRFNEAPNAVQRQNLRFVAVNLDRLDGLDGVLEAIGLGFARDAPFKESVKGAADVGLCNGAEAGSVNLGVDVARADFANGFSAWLLVNLPILYSRLRMVSGRLLLAFLAAMN
jgi:hypothetical protein